MQVTPPVDLTEQFTQGCDLGCGQAAAYIAKGCMDKEAVHMCGDCLQRGLDLIRKTVKMYQRLNKRILICGDCHRPVLTLETHLEIREL